MKDDDIMTKVSNIISLEKIFINKIFLRIKLTEKLANSFDMKRIV
jgi:hypothetical protein